MQELEAQLEKANKLIADGAKDIAELQAKVRRFQYEGKDIAEARNLLGHYHALQLRLAAEQDRLRKALTQIIK